MYEECRHIKTSGTKCESPALKGKAYCYFHFRAHQQRHRVVDRYAAFMAHKFESPLLEDRGAIQLAISEVVGAMAQNYMNHKRGGKILWGLQLALSGVKYPNEIHAPEPVRELFQNAEGEDIGTEMHVYEEGEEFPEDEQEKAVTAQKVVTVGKEDDHARASEIPKLSASVDPNIASERPKPKTLQQAVADYIAELKRKSSSLGVRPHRPAGVFSQKNAY